jgi:hypothetical protein
MAQRCFVNKAFGGSDRIASIHKNSLKCKFIVLYCLTAKVRTRASQPARPRGAGAN